MADLRTLLKNEINDEALRRMARRAGVQATSQKEKDHVNDALRGIAFQILENICEKLAIYTQYREAKTVSQADFRDACDQLKIKLGAYAVPNEKTTFSKSVVNIHLVREQRRGHAASWRRGKRSMNKRGKTVFIMRAHRSSDWFGMSCPKLTRHYVLPQRL